MMGCLQHMYLDDGISHVWQRDFAIIVHIQHLEGLGDLLRRHEELQVHGHYVVPAQHKKAHSDLSVPLVVERHIETYRSMGTM